MTREKIEAKKKELLVVVGSYLDNLNVENCLKTFLGDKDDYKNDEVELVSDIKRALDVTKYYQLSMNEELGYYALGTEDGIVFIKGTEIVGVSFQYELHGMEFCFEDTCVAIGHETVVIYDFSKNRCAQVYS